MAIGDRNDDDLDRSAPDREGTGEVLDEDADEALQRAVDGAVDGHRPNVVAVLVDVSEVETLG